MEVTKFVVSGRDKAKVFGDYATYRTQLSNRIHNLRKKLGIATKPRAKYNPKATISAEDIARSHEFVYLLLLTSERAWAHAMSMREVHSAEKKGITGSTRSHIISRLHKATTYANNLYEQLSNQAESGAKVEDVLEARAYAASLGGAREFEKQGWEPCVRSYSEARIIYSALSVSSNEDIFKDLLADPIDPSIRYGAYQMKLPRTVAISTIAKDYFPKSDTDLVSQVEKLAPGILSDQPVKAKADSAGQNAAPKTITWRSRAVDIEDAAISTALASVRSAETTLSKTLQATAVGRLKDRATAYDDILIASQDAVDASKHAIDELANEGVGQGDRRMQSLQITRTAVGYEMISWRIGRNRVLAGARDGAQEGDSTSKKAQEETTGRKLARFREKAVLYEAILQSLDSIKELPGVAADAAFGEELDAKYAYFSALKCLILAHSHALLSAPQKSLALLARASEKCTAAYTQISNAMEDSQSSPPNINISSTEVSFLKTLLQGEVQRYRALVELANLTEHASQEKNGPGKPLVACLNEYPPSGKIDLKNIVSFPPKMEPIPVKPLFFDVAWNYIEYPGREVQGVVANGTSGPPAADSEQATEQKKKGWFGFGR